MGHHDNIVTSQKIFLPSAKKANETKKHEIVNAFSATSFDQKYSKVKQLFLYSGFVTICVTRKRRTQNKESEDYEVAETTLSHYADLNIQAIKPSLYTDLSTINNHSNDYAEIEQTNAEQNRTNANTKA